MIVDEVLLASVRHISSNAFQLMQQEVKLQDSSLSEDKTQGATTIPRPCPPFVASQKKTFNDQKVYPKNFPSIGKPLVRGCQVTTKALTQRLASLSPS